MLNNNPSTPANQTKKQPKYTMRSILTVIGLTAFFVVAMFGVLIAQRQAQNPSEPVAPNAPASRPGATGPTATPALSAANCTLAFTVGGVTSTPPAVTITEVPTATPTPVADATCVKSVEEADNLAPGSTFVYVVNVSPLSTTTGNYTFSDTLPDQFEFVEFLTTNTTGWTHSGQTITGTIDGLSGTESKTFKFKVKVKPTAVANTSIVNTATLTGTNNSVSKQCQVAVSLPPYGSAQCVSKEAFRAPFDGQPLDQTVVEVGEDLEYRIKVSASQQTTGDVVVVDELPDQVTYVENSASINGVPAIPANVSLSGKTLSIKIGLMASNNTADERIVSFRVKVKDNATVGTFQNKASVTTNGANPENCPANTLEIPPRGIAMCEKDAYSSYASTTPLAYSDGLIPGQSFYYKIRVTANGDTRGNVTLKDELPSYIEYVGGANKTPANLEYDPATHTVNYTFSSLKDGDTKTVAFEAKVKATAVPSGPNEELEIKNKVKITTVGAPSGSTQPQLCQNILRVPPAAICESKTAYTSYSTDTNAQALAENQAVQPGYEFFYRVLVKASKATSGSVVVKDILPSVLEFSSDTSHNTPGISVGASNSATIDLGTMAANSEKLVEFKVKVKAGAAVGSFTNSATVTTGQNTSNADSCSHQLVIPPRGAAMCTSTDGKIAMTNFTAKGGTRIANNSNISPFQEMVYKLSITATEQTAGAVTVTDILPAVIEYIDSPDEVPSNITAQVQTDGTTKLTVALPQMNANETKNIEFKVRVKDNGTLGSVTNSLTVTTAGVTQSTIPSCAVSHTIPAPICNQTCTTDRQCQQANSSYVCDATSNTCRLDSNRSSTSCQPAPQNYACNSSCGSDTDCEKIGSNFFCSTEYGKTCRLKSNPGAANCQPKSTQPTPTPAIGCNDVCNTNADCSNPDHICQTTANGNRCRMAEYPLSSTCSAPGVYTPPTGAQPTLPPQLPQTGAEDWGEWLKAGVVILGLGGLLLLLL